MPVICVRVQGRRKCCGLAAEALVVGHTECVA